jgi:uncharacterized membrane-anchored protein
MTAPHRQKIAAFLLILPLLALGAIIAKNHFDIASSQSWRVKILGYDPRDLLYGHYLNFRFDWGLPSSPASCGAGQECCLCLEPRDADESPRASVQFCEASAKCATRLALPTRSACKDRASSCRRDADAFDPEGAQRYYVPESAATQLNALLTGRRHDLSVDLHVAASGQHYLGKLYIDGVEWSDYLSEHPTADQPDPAQTHVEHKWRMKIADARLYGDHLVFRLDWGAPLTRNACPDSNGCCALCLSTQEGSSQPAIQYKACGAQDRCLESLILPDTRRNSHADLGFDPDGPQRYSLTPDEAALMARALAASPKDIAIDVTTLGWSGAPTFGDVYVDGVEWRDYLRRQPDAKKSEEPRRRPK